MGWRAERGVRLLKAMRHVLDVEKHILIVGETRCGKTSLSKLLIRLSIERGWRPLIVDFDGEYGDQGFEELPIAFSRKLMPFILAKVVAKEGGTTGSATAYAVYRALKEASDLDDLIRRLELLAVDGSYSLRVGALAALSRLLPLVEYSENLILLEESSMYLRADEVRPGRIDLSSLPGWVREVAAALVLSSINLELVESRAVNPTLLVLEEAHFYFKEGGGEDIERIGIRKGVKVVRVQQKLPESYENYVLLLGTMGNDANILLRDLRLPVKATKLRRYEFMLIDQEAGKCWKIRMRA
ncbi:MAG: hypothetical protein DRN06_06040 [Thermoprotei archaeon]|nr:MAG: hypothetical protein DRN06_06040 [Thermoprotei archaeon]